jgi:hypothetical protein
VGCGKDEYEPLERMLDLGYKSSLLQLKSIRALPG